MDGAGDERRNGWAVNERKASLHFCALVWKSKVLKLTMTFQVVMKLCQGRRLERILCLLARFITLTHLIYAM